jgi:hypothetical protein
MKFFGLMKINRIAVLTLVLTLMLGVSSCGEQAEATFQGTTSNPIPMFSAPGTLVNSDLWEKPLFPNGIIGQGSYDYGSIGFGNDTADLATSYYTEAGPQEHFRLSRAYCDKSSTSVQTAADQATYFCGPDAITIDDTHPPATTPNKDLIIAPYRYGMAISYPGVLEAAVGIFSIHNNHTIVNNGGAVLTVGDNDDLGGINITATDAMVNGVLDRSQSFVSLTSQSFTGGSHGDMLFSVGDPKDNFRFQFGPGYKANFPGFYPEYTKARIDSTGKGFFDGGTQTGGADFAESISTSGSKRKYEPGDVLAIDPNSDRQVALSSGPYSTLVAGIYSTKPGVVGTLHRSEDPKLASEIPMAIVGIVPCNVSTENGPISRGDLLVTSSMPGYAMRGTDRARLSGAIIGKALQPLATGNGKIEVLITLR